MGRAALRLECERREGGRSRGLCGLHVEVRITERGGEMKKLMVALAVMAFFAGASCVYAGEHGEGEEVPHPSEPDATTRAIGCRFVLEASKWEVSGEDSARILVFGSIEVGTEGTEVALEKVVPQGINPTILMLDLKATSDGGAPSKHQRDFSYEETGEQVAAYATVQVTLNRDVPCTLEIY